MFLRNRKPFGTRFSGLSNDSSSFLFISFLGMSHICDNSGTSFAFFDERDTCFNLRKHGAGSKLIFLYVFLSICCRNGTKLLLICLAKIQAYILYAGKDEKCVCIQFFCKKSSSKILLNNSAGTVKVDAINRNRNTTAES